MSREYDPPSTTVSLLKYTEMFVNKNEKIIKSYCKNQSVKDVAWARDIAM